MMCFVLLLALAGQPQSDAAAAVQHIKAGIAAAQQKQYDTAIAEFQEAIGLDPTLAPAYVDLATVYMEQARPAMAIPPLRTAVKLDPTIPGAQPMLGVAFLLQGYSAEAIPYLKAADLKGPLGIAQLQTGDLGSSIANLQVALQQHPNDPELLFYLARASGLLSKQAGDRLLAVDPGSAQAHQALAENYWALQRVAEAEQEYRSALQIQPNLPGAHLALGEIYAGTQRWPKAVIEFQAEAALRPGNAETAYRLGDALLQDGKIHPARIELQRANKLQPNMPETIYALGKAESLDGDLAGAEASWTHLLQIEQNSNLAAKAHFALAALYRKQGKPAKAAEEMKAFERIKTAQTQ